MRFRIAVGVFCVCLSIASVSCSREASHFQRVKAANGDVLCGTSPSNKTVDGVKSRIHCATMCYEDCTSINFWKDARVCELFDYVPCTYGVQQGCANYQVTTTEF